MSSPLVFVVALLLAAIEFRTTRWNIGTPHNGYGALRGALARVTVAPMSNRVLLPWLVGWLPWPYRLGAYLIAKGMLCWWALALYEPLAGPVGVLILAILILSTIRFDYWSGYAELVGVLLCLTGQPAAVVVGAVVWGMSRETVLLAPFLAWPWGLIGPAVFLAVAVWQGLPPLVCSRWWLPRNARELHFMWKQPDLGTALSLALSIATLVMVLSERELPPPLGRTAWAPLMWIGAGLTIARTRETRVLLPATLWLAAGLVGLA